MKAIDIEKFNRYNFRSMMNALACPGDQYIIQPLFKSHLLAVANVLLYAEVGFFYQGVEEFDLIDAITHAKRQTLAVADYVFCDSLNNQVFNTIKTGSFSSPENSATVIIKCHSLAGLAAGLAVRLSGPGIADNKQVNLPIDEDFIEKFSANNRHYPLGNEVFFVDDKGVVSALSRTTKLELV